MKRRIAAFFLILFCISCVMTAASMAGQGQWAGMKKELDQALQSGEIDQNQYDIAMADMKRMQSLSASDQQRINEGLQEWKQ